MTYEQALEYIHTRNKYGIKLGLDRMRALLEIFNHPQLTYPSIHIAGTNGKGSTTAMVSVVLREAGYKVGRFTSPHLSSYCERLSINGVNIKPERLAYLVTDVQPILDKAAMDPRIGHPTEFEVGAVLAFKYFAEEKVDLAIFEVGMGGRLDATNVITPLVCGITHIALDHQEFLGADLVSIAKEKAGIIKADCPVVVGVQAQEVREVMQATAATLKSPLYSVGKEIRYEVIREDLTGTELELRWEEEPPFLLKLNLLGEHQAANAAVAFGLLQVIKTTGFPWKKNDLEKGFSEIYWPGRMEYLPGPPSIIMDGAHNLDGMSVLARGLRRLFPGKEIQAVVGILDNRPVEAIASLLSSILGSDLRKVYATTVPDPKSASCDRVARAFRDLGVETVEVEDALTALNTAECKMKVGELLVVTGSLYLLGYLRPYILKRRL